MKKILGTLLALVCAANLAAQPLNNKTVDGYRGIWFTLGQFSEYGDKYSGGLGTYTMKHIPLAIYAPEVEKTYFVYGGTTAEDEKHLLCMIGSYDHRTGMVSKPVVVYDKEEVEDPHDDPALLIDPDGYIWVYVSGRNTARMGFKYRSVKPYDISGFEKITEEVMTYPQPLYIEGEGFIHFFTKYTGLRELYFETSRDGVHWTEDMKLAGMKYPGDKLSGHYQFTNHYGNKIVTAMNRHPNGNVDKRTNIYVIQSTDFGKTWTTVDGQVLDIPLTDPDSPSRVVNSEAEGKNLYIKDINLDRKGNPVILYLTSAGHLPGPKGGVRQWYTIHWDGKKWHESPITTSTHNYDSGSLWVDGKNWTVIAPTDKGPQEWGTGGELVVWRSRNEGKSWERVRNLTSGSERNHGYVRRPVNARAPFYAFWADGDPDRMSISYLYFGDAEGNVYRLPYHMTEEWAKPEKIK